MEPEDNYCRLCMAEEDLKPMSSGVINCIKNELFIEIENNDVLSREICNECANFVLKCINFREEIEKFKEKSSKVQKLLLKIVKRKDVKDADVSNQSMDADVSNQSISQPKTVVKRKDVKNAAVSSPSVSRPVINEPEQEKLDPEPVPTDIENLTDTNVENELISKLIKSIDFNEVEKLASKINFNAEDNCEICRRKMSDRAKFIKHVQSSSHKFKSYIVSKFGEENIFEKYVMGYTCQMCRQTFTSKVTLSVHSKNQHNVRLNKNNIKPNTLIHKTKNEPENVLIKEEPNEENSNSMKKNPCKICTKSFVYKETLLRHMKKQHDTYFCTHCAFSTMNKNSFTRHFREHFNLTYLQRLCSICFKVCDSYVALSQHRKQFHEAKQTLLKKHKRDVHRMQNVEPSARKVLKCRKCNRTFMSLLVLEKHQCTAFKYPCLKNCGKRFETFSQMERHSVKCNAGKTIYSCDNCNKNLKNLQSLKTHMLKCLAVSSTPSTSAENQQTAKITESCSPSPMPRDTSKEITNINAFTCTKCNQSILIDDLKDHVKTCSVRTEDKSKSIEKKNSNFESRLIEQNTTLKRKLLKRKQRELKLAKSKERKLRHAERQKERIKLKFVAEKKFLPPSQNIACKLCGLIFKNDEFLAQHGLIAHSTLADEVAQNSTKTLNQNVAPSTSFDQKALTKERKKSNDQQSSTENRFHGSELLQMNNEKSADSSNRQISWKSVTISKQPSVEISSSCIPTTPSVIIEQRIKAEPSFGNTTTTASQKSETSLKSTVSPRKEVSMRNERIQISSENTPQKSASFSQKMVIRNDQAPEQSLTGSYQNRIRVPEISAENKKQLENCQNQMKDEILSKTSLEKPVSSQSSVAQLSRWDVAHRTPNRNDHESRQKSYTKQDRNSRESDISKRTRESDYSERTRESDLYSKRTREYSNRTRESEYSKRTRESEYSKRTRESEYSKKTRESDHSRRTESDCSKRNDHQHNVKLLINSSDRITKPPAICKICRNPAFHLFCIPCMRCFTDNQVQYLNHMKMKHSW